MMTIEELRDAAAQWKRKAKEVLATLTPEQRAEYERLMAGQREQAKTENCCVELGRALGRAVRG